MQRLMSQIRGHAPDSAAGMRDQGARRPPAARRSAPTCTERYRVIYSQKINTRLNTGRKDIMEKFDGKLEDLQILSKGYWGNVYVLSDELLLKTSPNYTAEMIESEYRRGRAVFEAGVPCAEFMKLVETEEGLGIIYDRIEGGSIGRRAMNHLESLDTYLDAHEKLCRKMWATKIVPGDLPTMKSQYMRLCDPLSKILDAETMEAYRAFFEALPEWDRFVHMDLHWSNVMYNNGECRLIDLAYAAVGHPAFDLASIAFAYNIMPGHPINGGYQKTFRISPEDAHYVWSGMARRVFAGLPAEVAAERKKAAECMGRLIFLKNYMQDVILGVAAENDIMAIREHMKKFLFEESEFVLRVLKEWEL